MYSTVEELILASASPRRQQFFQELGVRYRVEVASIDESVYPGEDPRSYVCRLAKEKGETIACQHPGRWVVAADTIVVYGKEILGKPQDPEDALQTLCRLSGNTHSVLTAFSLVKDSFYDVECVETKVTFRQFTKNVAQRYVDCKEPLDKAGSYGIQGVGGALVHSIVGSYSNVVGLPLSELLEKLAYYKLIDV